MPSGLAYMSGAAHPLAFALFAMAWSSAARSESRFTGRSATETASRIADISSVLFVGAALIFLVVVVLVAIGIFGPVRVRRQLGRPALILCAGIAFPVGALTILLIYTLRPSVSMNQEAAPAVRIEVIGELWWWRIRYLDEAGAVVFETANEFRIPVGKPVELLLESDNVIHSFWVPALGGKLDMIPGRVNRLVVQADEAGVFAGQCAEYCGAQHAKMRLTVQAVAPAPFEAWVSRQRQPAKPADAELRPGEQRFLDSCAVCHTVRGTSAKGAAGPDLTHLGSRSSLASGTLTNNVGAIAGWITESQHIKPGNLMPSFAHWSGEELRAVAAYLDSLQ